MIDFKNATFLKLKPIKIEEIIDIMHKMFLDDENVFAAFKTVRDQLVFTDKRIIAANVQGITGKKIDFTSIPYSRIQTFSVETAGLIDLDCELEIFVSSIGPIHFDITGGFDIVAFSKLIGKYIL
ncbi:MAG: PH domain-containing protein [Ignavibacteriaceae bacterium]|nr:PH domain-containing protein [Ignavibacteriaceae bacterium]